MLSILDLNFDCITEIGSHLDFKNYHNLKNTSKFINELVNDKNNIKCCYNGEWGTTSVSGKKYTNHYFGEVIIPKKNYTKSINGFIRHGIGIFTKRLGKYTVEVYRGLYYFDKLKSNHFMTYIRNSFTYKNGPYKGEVMPELTLEKFNYTFSFADTQLNSDYLIKYNGGWKDKKPHGFGYSKELVRNNNYNKFYNPQKFQLSVQHGFIEHYGTWKNGLKHGLFEERWNIVSPYNKYIRYVTYHEGNPIGKSIYICRRITWQTNQQGTVVLTHDIDNNTIDKKYINDINFFCKNICFQTFVVNKLQTIIDYPFDTEKCNNCKCKLCKLFY